MIILRLKSFRVLFALILCGSVLTTAACFELAPDKRPVVNILFIGNSYTFFNEMPKIFKHLVNANSDSPVQVSYDMSAVGGADFKMHWERGEPLQKIQSRNDWHYVIFQNQSGWAMEDQRTKDAYSYGGMFAKEVFNHGGVPVVMMTWPRQQGSLDYQRWPWYKNFEYSYNRLKYTSYKVAGHMNGLAVPIGDYWVLTLSKHPEISLYNPDGSHPSLQGSYLMALVLYKLVIGKALDNPDLRPAQVTEEEAKVLQAIVKNYLRTENVPGRVCSVFMQC